VRVVGLSDPVEDAMSRTASELPARPERLSSDYRALLDLEPDIACIASPDQLHIPQLLDCLATGCHALCEKPLTPDPDALSKAIEAARQAERHVAMTYPRRYHGPHKAMRREILSGRWGKVVAVTVYNAEDWITPNRGTWRHDPQLCPGGFFYDAGGHQLDSVFWATGLEPVRVRMETRSHGTPSPMEAWGMATLSGGVPLTFHYVGVAHKWREQINIHCEATEFVIENMQPRMVLDGETRPVEPDEPSETADEAFLKLLRGEGPNRSPLEEIWPVLRFNEAALGSADSGEVRTISL
jgi:predicted dehydrogenase